MQTIELPSAATDPSPATGRLCYVITCHETGLVVTFIAPRTANNDLPLAEPDPKRDKASISHVAFTWLAGAMPAPLMPAFHLHVPGFADELVVLFSDGSIQTIPLSRLLGLCLHAR